MFYRQAENFQSCDIISSLEFDIAKENAITTQTTRNTEAGGGIRRVHRSRYYETPT